MESGCSTSSTLKKRGHARKKDMISNILPESIITDILSLLPIKEAVRTCVLSKRWIHRWTSITKLELDDSELQSCYSFCRFCNSQCILASFENVKDGSTICLKCWACDYGKVEGFRIVDIDEVTKRKDGTNEKVNRFVNFVRRILLTTIDLESFSFVINHMYDVSLLYTWISNILNKRVKKLKIDSPSYKLPFSALTSYFLFNSSSTSLLQELELILKLFSTIHVSMNSLHFQHLKLINLSGIFFKIDPSIDSMNLNLPVLNKFNIKNCNWSSQKDVIVHAPLLESVSMEQGNKYYKPETYNAPCNRSIKFNALHLKEFTYCGYVISQKVHLPSYESAKIILRKCNNKVSEKGRLPIIGLLLQQFHYVKSIRFEQFH